MSTRYYTFSFTVLFFALCACHNVKAPKKANQFYQSDFKAEAKIPGVIHAIDSMNMPADICIIPEKNLLLLIDIRDQNFVKAYELSSRKFIKAFAHKGAKLNEQMTCQSIQYRKSDQALYLSDFVKKKIYKFSINSIKRKHTSALPIDSLPIATNFLNRPLVLDNTIVDLRSNFMQSTIGELNIFNRDGALIAIKGSYPKTEKHYQPVELKAAFAAAFSLSTDGKTMVINYANTDIIDLYDTSGSLTHRMQGPDIFEPSIISESVMGGTMSHPTKDAKNGYAGKAHSDGNRLFVLYDGSPASNPDYHVNTLYCFDQNLAPLKMYTLSQPIFAFDIDWSTMTLIGLTHKIKNSVITYQLK